MRFLHTADWHLGRQIRGKSRAAEFEAVLSEIVEIATAEKVDALLVAGDIWDTASPSPDALRDLRDRLEGGNESFVQSAFHDRLARAYENGVSFLLGVDVATLIQGELAKDPPLEVIDGAPVAGPEAVQEPTEIIARAPRDLLRGLSRPVFGGNR